MEPFRTESQGVAKLYCLLKTAWPRLIALECEEGDVAYAESVCATEELKFYKDNVDRADMTSLKKPTTEHDPDMKFKSDEQTKLVDFVPGDSSKQFSISTNLDPK